MSSLVRQMIVEGEFQLKNHHQSYQRCCSHADDGVDIETALICNTTQNISQNLNIICHQCSKTFISTITLLKMSDFTIYSGHFTNKMTIFRYLLFLKVILLFEQSQVTRSAGAPPCRPSCVVIQQNLVRSHLAGCSNSTAYSSIVPQI